MPTASFSTLATGTRQFVVQEALATTWCSWVSLCALPPNTTVRSAPEQGAETSTRLAPAVRCFAAPTRSVKRPVHSITMSMPRSRQGSLSGVASESTATFWPSVLRWPSATLILPRKRPCTLSNSRRWAFISAEPRSLMATKSRACRPDGGKPLKVALPIRPNPLMATRLLAMSSLTPRTCNQTMGGGGNRLSRYAEMLISVLSGRRSTEPVDTDEGTVRSEPFRPTELSGRLDCDPRGSAENRIPISLTLGLEQLPTRHRNNSGVDPLTFEHFGGLDRESYLRAGADQRHVALALRLDQHIGALGRQILFGVGCAERLHALTSERKDGGRALGKKRKLPAFGTFDRVSRTHPVRVRQGAQGGQVLDGVMCRAVLSEPDRVVRH